MRLDAHQHFWQLDRGDYDWPDETVEPIRQDFMPADLKPRLDAAGIEKTVLVQATDTVEETSFLLALGYRNDWIAGVVGWVQMSAPDAPSQIAALAADPKLCGLRPMLQGIDQTDWILQAAVQPALEALQHHDLCLDALIQPRHLNVICQLARRYPDLSIVIDHMAKPQMKNGSAPDPDWCKGMAEAARCPNINVKLSGMVTECDGPWERQTLEAHFAQVLASFGPERIIFGSDWPVCLLGCSYQDWIEVVQSLIAPLSTQHQAAIMGRNGAAVYRLSGD